MPLHLPGMSVRSASLVWSARIKRAPGPPGAEPRRAGNGCPGGFRVAGPVNRDLQRDRRSWLESLPFGVAEDVKREGYAPPDPVRRPSPQRLPWAGSRP